MHSCLADLRGANGHGLGNVQRDGGIVSEGFLVQIETVSLCEAYT